MISISSLLKHYKREDIQKAIVESAQNKEVAMKFGEKGYGKRPDVLQQPRDVLELAKLGATSFHCSEELWSNPSQIGTNLSRTDLDNLRSGWDLLLDIDCPVLDYSKIAADLLIQALSYHGIKCVSAKFSGNHGFHIAVPFEAFPEKVQDKDAIKETRTLFPEGPQRIARYLQEMIRANLSRKLLAMDDLSLILKKTGTKKEDLVKNNTFDPFSVLKIDTVLISSRHLYRMPYSFNEKSGLVSIPVDPKKILEFDKNLASPENVKVEHFFLDRTVVKKGEARQLFSEAFDSKITKEEKSIAKSRDFEMPQNALSENLFPPCIQLLSKGIRDGKKRAVFILINFLSSVGWDYDKIEQYLRDWNKRNPGPLREVMFMGQLRYHKAQKKKMLPPNCANKSYYADLGICCPEALCRKVKNPVNYSLIRARMLNREKEVKEE